MVCVPKETISPAAASVVDDHPILVGGNAAHTTVMIKKYTQQIKVLGIGFCVIAFIMKFKKGSKVEVLSKEMPSCSWFPAQVISGNGRSYSVGYDCSTGTTADPIVEKVSRKVIRPSPSVVSVKSWVVGEMVEVSHAGSWRTVVVSKVMGGDYYLVRPLGSLREVKVHMFNIRVR